MKKGISLIVLVITIIIMIIIAGAIILSLNSSNVTGRAKLSTLASDRSSLKAEYAVAYANAMAYLDTKGVDVDNDVAFALAVGQTAVTLSDGTTGTLTSGTINTDKYTGATYHAAADSKYAYIDYTTNNGVTWRLYSDGEVYAQVTSLSAYSLVAGSAATYIGDAPYAWVYASTLPLRPLV